MAHHLKIQFTTASGRNRIGGELPIEAGGVLLVVVTPRLGSSVLEAAWPTREFYFLH